MTLDRNQVSRLPGERLRNDVTEVSAPCNFTARHVTKAIADNGRRCRLGCDVNLDRCRAAEGHLWGGAGCQKLRKRGGLWEKSQMDVSALGLGCLTARRDDRRGDSGALRCVGGRARLRFPPLTSGRIKSQTFCNCP